MGEVTATVRRVVVKVGSSTLTHEGGGVDAPFLASLATQIAGLRLDGIDVVVVSSGAIALGVTGLRLESRPTDMPGLQAAAAVGQVALVDAYAAALAEHDVVTAQVLLTRHDTGHRESYLHARDTFERLLGLGVVPVVNENDTVAVDEIRFGDNDTLAALVATLVSADLVVLLSDIEGLYDADPRQNESAQLLSTVGELSAEMVAAAGGAGTGVGSGGMATKVDAAKVLMRAGIPMVVCRGDRANVLSDAVSGVQVGTLFEGGEARIGARKQWIALAHRPSGEVVVDDGARIALTRGGGSLLPVGVTAVRGVFSAGDAVVLCDASGEVFARGLAELSSVDLLRVMGLKSDRIASVAPELAGIEVVHRDRLVVL